MIRYFVRRVLSIIPTLIIITITVFLFLHMIPGDPARLLAGQDATETDVKLIQAELGLDKPLYQQYYSYMSKLIRGDLGTSMKTRKPVIEEIEVRFMPTLVLTVLSMFWAALLGLVIGVISAANQNKWQDHFGMFIAVSGISLPHFWVGLMLMQIFSVRLGWLPTMGNGSWKNFILPSITLGGAVAAEIARFTRSALIEVLKEDYIRTARSKGLGRTIIICKHAMRNALIPIITIIGLRFGFLLGGSIVLETVFAWPGLGKLLIDSVGFRDYPVIQAEILLFSLEFVVINLVVDFLYACLNPEIKYHT